MTTITKQLADALRTARTAAAYTDSGEVDLPGLGEDWMSAAHNALAAYDAQREETPSGWAHEDDTIYRDDGIAIAHCFSEQSTAATIVGEHTAARIVQCVNAHDALVSALQGVMPYAENEVSAILELADDGDEHADEECEAATSSIEAARAALAQAGVTP